LKGDEVILAIRGAVGSVAVVGRDLIGVNVSREIAVIPIRTDHVDRGFVAYALSTPEVQQMIDTKTRGAAQKGINLADVAELRIPLPALSVQVNIARQLNEYRTALRTLRQSLVEQDMAINALSASLLRRAFSGEL